MRDVQKAFSDAMGNDYRGGVMYKEVLSRHTSLGVGGPADIYVVPADAVSLRKCLLFAKDMDFPLLVVGSGTNIVVSDSGFRGMVVSLKSFNMIKLINDRHDTVELFVEAGMPLQKLIHYCVENGYAGIEGLSGIPGRIGGAIVGNTGSYEQEIKDVVVSLIITNTSGMIRRLEPGEFSFGYRTSGIPEGSIVLSATMEFQKADSQELKKKVSEYLSRKKNTQPLSDRSAGCVYKNPKGESSGKLIDSSGCKGMRVGGIEVSNVHANFFINRGNGTAADFLELMKLVENKVAESTGISLEPEVRIVGNGPEAL